MASEMTLHEYQLLAVGTAIYPANTKVIYPLLGINGELKELEDKLNVPAINRDENIKKWIRDNDKRLAKVLGKIQLESDLNINDTLHEVGDILWYLANLCNDLGVSLGVVAKMNIDKLRSRQERGVIQGSGDNR